jgi:uncharacterized protein YfeS
VISVCAFSWCDELAILDAELMDKPMSNVSENETWGGLRQKAEQTQSCHSPPFPQVLIAALWPMAFFRNVQAHCELARPAVLARTDCGIVTESIPRHAGLGHGAEESHNELPLHALPASTDRGIVADGILACATAVSKPNASCHSSPFPRALIEALWPMTFLRNRLKSKPNASCHAPHFSQALLAALWLQVSLSTVPWATAQSKPNASCHSRPSRSTDLPNVSCDAPHFSQALIAALLLKVSLSIGLGHGGANPMRVATPRPPRKH